MKKLVLGEHGKTYLCCPTCRRITRIPSDSGVSSLPSAFYVHHLFDIKNALEKVKEPQTAVCQKCTSSTKVACSYCLDCGEFICQVCTGVHSEWGSLKAHEVIPLSGFEEKVKELKALRKVTLKCQLHPGKVLELFCETCMELICHNCIVKKHKDHQYDLVDDVFEKNKDKLVKSLEPIETHIGEISEAIQGIGIRSKEVDDQLMAMKGEIERNVKHLVEVLQAQQNNSISQLTQLSREKLKNLTQQKDDLQATKGELDRCVSFVRESLSTNSKGEVLKLMKMFTKQIESLPCKDHSADSLLPCEPANLKFRASSDVEKACSCIGAVYLDVPSPEKCYATGSGLEVAVLSERTTVIIHSMNDDGIHATLQYKTYPVSSSVKAQASNQKAR